MLKTAVAVVVISFWELFKDGCPSKGEHSPVTRCDESRETVLGLSKRRKMFALLSVAPLPIVIVHVPVCPAAGVLAARVAVVPVRESWSGPAEEVV